MWASQATRQQIWQPSKTNHHSPCLWRPHSAISVETSRTHRENNCCAGESQPLQSTKTTLRWSLAQMPYCWPKSGVATAASSRLTNIWLTWQLILLVPGVERNHTHSSTGLRNVQWPKQLDRKSSPEWVSLGAFWHWKNQARRCWCHGAACRAAVSVLQRCRQQHYQPALWWIWWASTLQWR